MTRIITNHELWSLSSEEMAKLTKGKFVRIVLKNGESRDIYVKNLSVTGNNSSFCGFITAYDNNIDIQDIDYVEL